MSDSIFSYNIIAYAAYIILAWEIIKRVVRFFSREASGVGSDPQKSEDFDDMQVPSEPHCEIVLDPPCGLHLSNPKEPYSFNNEHCYGDYLFFHPPVPGGNSQGPESFNYVEYFTGKSRLWEIRVRMRFKKPPTPETNMFFGVELEDYVPLSMATKQAQNLTTAAIRKAIAGLYQSAGDNPSNTQDELELPICVLPLWAFDQFIETPEGQEPPSLTDPGFSNLGKKRYTRAREYAAEVGALQKTLNAQTTYTFAFWGCSRFLDVINWMVIGVPLATPIDFNKFAGRPPVRVVLYALAPSEEESSKEKRHLQSRKRYYFRAAVWSSCKRPERQRIEELVGIANSSDPVLQTIEKQKNLRQRFTSFMKHSVAEPLTSSCVTRVE